MQIQARSVRRGELFIQQDLSGHVGPIERTVTTLLDAGKADGTIQPDVDARDVILLISFLSQIEEAEADERAHHVLELILDGLRRRADDS